MPDTSDPAPGGLFFSSPVLLSGARLEALAATLAEQLLLLYGARPADPRARLDGNLLTFTFHSGLSGSDELLLTSGQEEKMRQFREQFLEAASIQGLNEIVSSFVHADVAFFFNAFDSPSRTTSCFFVLQGSGDPRREAREAIRNWGEQVRRNARHLRARHSLIREEHRKLRVALHEARPGSDRG